MKKIILLESLTTGRVTSALSVIGQLIFLLVLFGLVLWLAYKATSIIAGQQKRSSGHNLEIIESLQISPQVMISLVRTGATFVLVGITKETVTFLKDIDPALIDLSTIDKNVIQKELSVTDYLEKFVARHKEGGSVDRETNQVNKKSSVDEKRDGRDKNE